MRVCFLIDDFSATGGIQRVVPIVANGLSDYHDVFVLSMYQEHGDGNYQLYKNKPETIIQGKKKYIQQAFKVVALLKEYLNKNKIDILITCSEMLTPYAYLATKSNKIPFVCWCHTDAGQLWLPDLFKKMTAHKADGIVALTDKNNSYFKNTIKAKNKVYTVSNPIDPKLLTNDYDYDSNSKKLITVGRICYQKYYEKLVEVAAIVFRNYPDWHWDTYGDGPDKEKIISLIKDNHIEDNLHIIGNVDDLYDRYHNYAFLVMTSRFECYPMVLLEAMANKLPMISFNIPGSDEIIENDVNGYLTECFDTQKMADKIIELIESKEKRIELSKGNDILIEKHTINTIVALWNKLISEVIDEKNN